MPSASSSSASSAASSSTAAAKDPYSPHGPFGAAFEIRPGTQHYEWGMTQEDGALVAKLAAASNPKVQQAKAGTKFAELWMGTHPTVPSFIIPPPNSPAPPDGSSIPLASYLARHPVLLGARPRYFRRPAGELPFLFKILSVGKALSIQAHPDKELGKKLHSENSKSYKDDNHKPEMAIALTDFEGFCGFRPLSEMHKYLDAVPEFAQVVNAPVAFVSELAYASQPSAGTTDEETRSWVRGIFGRLMRAQSTTYKTAVMQLAARYRQALDDGKAAELEVEEDVARLVVRLNEQYPADIGVLCTFVLNVVQLKPGQAMFLGANEPHAYLRGEIVECMAASDNVVRAGLTPKERDVETLVGMLTYSTGGPEKQRMTAAAYPPAESSANANAYASPKEKDDGTPDVPSLLYDPPIEEFSVLRTCLGPGASETQKALDGPSILLVTQGTSATIVARPRPLPQEQQANGTPRSRSNSAAANGHTLAPDAPREFAAKQPGHTYFVGAGCEVELRNDGDEELVVFRAFVEAPEE